MTPPTDELAALPLVPAPTLTECVETLRRLVFSDVPKDQKSKAFATALRLVGQARDHADGLSLCSHHLDAKVACRSLHPPLRPSKEPTDG